MSKSRKSPPDTTWVTVPVDDTLHGEVRAHAVRQHKGLPVVVAEAMKLWLSAQTKRVA